VGISLRIYGKNLVIMAVAFFSSDATAEQNALQKINSSSFPQETR